MEYLNPYHWYLSIRNSYFKPHNSLRIISIHWNTWNHITVWFGLVWFGLVWFGLVLWLINNCWLFNAKSCFYMYIKYIWFVNTFCRYTLLNHQAVQFLAIQFSIVKCFSVFLCITNNSIKHQSFVYSQLNNIFVLFLTIQFCISHSFALSLNVKHFYLIYR